MKAHKRTPRMTWREAWPVWLILGSVLVFGVAGVWAFFPTSEIAAKKLQVGEDAKLRVGDLRLNVPVLFAYLNDSGRKSEFFAEREAGDNITVAFASCRKCLRSGHFRQGSQIFCGQCNAPMVRATDGQTPSPDKDCTEIPIPYERSGDRLTIRASTVDSTFTRWYGPQL